MTCHWPIITLNVYKLDIKKLLKCYIYKFLATQASTIPICNWAWLVLKWHVHCKEVLLLHKHSILLITKKSLLEKTKISHRIQLRQLSTCKRLLPFRPTSIVFSTMCVWCTQVIPYASSQATSHMQPFFDIECPPRSPHHGDAIFYMKLIVFLFYILLFYCFPVSTQHIGMFCKWILVIFYRLLRWIDAHWPQLSADIFLPMLCMSSSFFSMILDLRGGCHGWRCFCTGELMWYVGRCR